MGADPGRRVLRIEDDRGVLSAQTLFDAVMAAQRDLAEVVHTLKQVVCVKG